MGNNHFETGGDNYAEFRPTYPIDLVKSLAATCASHHHAVDIGCGTGQLSALLASEFDQVTALDPSASQIENAEKNARVSYAVKTAEDTGLPDNSVDLVVAAQAAHWFDLPKFYREVERITKRDGVIALVSYGVPTLMGAIGERFAQFYWQDIHHFWPDARKHVERGYKDLDFPYAELAFDELAIQRDWTRDQLLGYISTWSAARKAEQAGKMAFFEQFSAELHTLWPDDNTRSIQWPITVRMARMGR